jgi:SAM-dependent methyltransferase
MHTMIHNADPETLDPSEFITNISQGPDGVWRPNGVSAVSYPAHGHDDCMGVEDSSFWFLHRNRCIAAVVERHPPQQGRPFADVGGGNGFVARMLHDLGYRMLLIEPGETGIRNARGRGLPGLVNAATDDLDIVQESLGAVGLFDVIEHIPDDEAALRSFLPLLAPGGMVYATVPAHRWLWTSIDEEAGHQRRYTRDGLVGLFERCGFDVALASYIFFPLPLPMFAMRVLRERIVGKKNKSMRINTEHRPEGGLLQALLSREIGRLRDGHVIPHGASCIIAAKKPVHV